MGNPEAESLAASDPCVRHAAEPDQPPVFRVDPDAGIQNRALEIRVQRLEEELAEQKKELERQKEKEVESLGRMVLDIENMKREFRKFYQLAESLTGMQNDLNQFRKVASDVRQMKTAMSQLQVSAKLNGNAVARILQQMQEQEPEPDSTGDSAES